MDRWFLIAATLLAAIGGVTGMLSLRHDHRSRWTFPWMAAAFLAQLGFLSIRGEARAACPPGCGVRPALPAIRAGSAGSGDRPTCRRRTRIRSRVLRTMFRYRET